MIQSVWIAFGLLAMIALMDRRSWLMLSILVLVAIQTALSDVMVEDRLMAVAMRFPIDLSAGLLTLGVVRRERWSMAVPAIFAVTLLCHAVFWLGRANQINLWLPYAHALNGLFLAQMLSVATPGGGRTIGRLGSWLGDLSASWSRRHIKRPSAACQARHDAQADRPADGRPGPDLFLSSEARA